MGVGAHRLSRSVRGVQGRPRLWKPTTAAGWASITGYTPEIAFTCSEAGGDLIDQIGSDDFSIVNDPRYQGTPLPGGALGIEADEGDFDAFQAADGTVWDHGNASHAMVAVIYVRAATGSSLRTWLGGKWDGSVGTRSAWIKNSSGKATTQLDDGTNSGTAIPDYVPAAGDLIVSVSAVDRVADTVAMALAPAGGAVVSTSADISSVNDASHASAARLLSLIGSAAGDLTLLELALFGGANADGMAADVAAIAERVRRWHGRHQ